MGGKDHVVILFAGHHRVTKNKHTYLLVKPRLLQYYE